jgi:hypothetical protein
MGKKKKKELGINKTDHPMYAKKNKKKGGKDFLSILLILA